MPEEVTKEEFIDLKGQLDDLERKFKDLEEKPAIVEPEKFREKVLNSSGQLTHLYVGKELLPIVTTAPVVPLWEVDGSETQLKTADEIDMRSKKIINLAAPVSDNDAARKVDAAGLLTAIGEEYKGQGTSGEQVCTHNLGVLPKLIKITAALDLGSDHLAHSYGHATGTDDEYTLAATSQSGGVNVEIVSGYIITLYDLAGGDSGKATLSAVSTTTFTIDWTTAPAGSDGAYFIWEVIA